MTLTAPERRIWVRVYLQCIARGDKNFPQDVADAAIRNLRERNRGKPIRRD